MNRKLSKTTTFLLAGRDTEGSKIKKTRSNPYLGKVHVTSLLRLDELLRGKMSLDKLKKLEILTRDNFKGSNYQPAGEDVSTSNAASSEAASSVASSNDEPSSETSAASDTSSNEAITSETSTSIPTNVS